MIKNTGSGYGSKSISSTGNVYYQTYGATRKLTKNGEFVWGRGINSGNTQGISVDNSENVYIAGSNNFFAAKFNSNGDLQWQRTLAPIGTGIGGDAQDIVTNTIGTSYIAGTYINGGNTYAAISCVMSDGGHLWSLYNTTANTYYQGVGYNAGVGMAVAAGTYGSGAGVHVTAFAGGNGSVQWQRTITPTDGQTMWGMGCTMDASGNVYVTGMSGSVRHSFVVKYNSSGTFQWARQLEIPGVYSYNDYATPGTDADGNVYISFYQDYNNNEGSKGGGFAKFNSSGTLQFIRRIDVVTGVLRINVASDGTVVLMGTAAIAKLKGDGSGLGTYSDFSYSGASLTATTPSFNYNTAGFGYASPGFASTPSGYSLTYPSISPAVQYIGTEVG